MDLTMLIFLTTTQTQETVLRISDDINPFVKATYAIFSKFNHRQCKQSL